MKEFKEILIPNIFKEYSCQSCGECCENKWNINFDNKCYEKVKEYLLNKGESLEEYLVKKNNEEALVNFDEKKYCKFMDRDGLCIIQKDLGWESLSNTCKDYPRYKYLTKRGLEVGFSFSCTTSALNLFDKRKFEIVKVKREEMFMMLPTNITALIPEYDMLDYKRNYFDREEKLIKIFNNRDETLKESFIKALPLILEDGNEVLEGIKEDEEGVANLINRYLSIRGVNEASTQEYLYLLKSYNHKKIFSKIWRIGDIDLNKETIEEVYKAWNDENDYILRHYICNYIFSKNLFISPIPNFLQLLVILNMIKIYSLFYENQLNKKLNKSQMIRTIANVESNYGHSAELKNKFNENLLEGGIIDLAINTFVNQL